MDNTIKLLYVDDEENNLMSFKATFRMEYQVFIAKNAAEGRLILDTEKDIGVIISDQRMPQESGVEFFVSILDVYPNAVRILLTGYTDIQALIDAVNRGHIYRYLQKPWKADELRYVINQGYELYKLRVDNQRLTNELKKVNNQLEFLYRQTLLT